MKIRPYIEITIILLVVIILTIGGALFVLDMNTISPQVLEEFDTTLENIDKVPEILVFSDYDCPYCASQHDALKELATIQPIKVTYKQFPIHNLEKAAYAECAREQDEFYGMSDLLFKGMEADLAAAALDLNMEMLKNCLERGKSIAKDHMLHGEMLGVKGTPTIFIDGHRYDGYQSAEKLRGYIWNS